MNRWKLALLLALGVAALLLVVFYSHRAHRQERATVLAQSWAIGRELVSQTNSPHLLFPGNLFQRTLASLLTSPTQVEAVKYGDEPQPAGAIHAASRIYLVNQKGSRLALRLKPEGDAAHFRVLGWWVPTGPVAPDVP